MLVGRRQQSLLAKVLIERQPKVQHDRLALLGHHQIARLYVAMHHAALVGVMQRTGHLLEVRKQRIETDATRQPRRRFARRLRPEEREPAVQLRGEEQADQLLQDGGFADSAQGKLAWEIFGGTLRYAADLVPEIADDIVNIDNAIRWGFNWAQGPFELLDSIGIDRVITKIEAEGASLPKMLQVAKDAGVGGFYRGEGDGREYLTLDGEFAPLP